MEPTSALIEKAVHLLHSNSSGNKKTFRVDTFSHNKLNLPKRETEAPVLITLKALVCPRPLVLQRPPVFTVRYLHSQPFYLFILLTLTEQK